MPERPRRRQGNGLAEKFVLIVSGASTNVARGAPRSISPSYRRRSIPFQKSERQSRRHPDIAAEDKGFPAPTIDPGLSKCRALRQNGLVSKLLF
jgi:hypothetical protein